MWLWGSRGQGVWRGEVFVWQRHRQWGGEAGEMRSGQGVWRGESFVPTVCGAGRCESVARERGRGGKNGRYGEGGERGRAGE